jgi:hypothetical protein
MIGISSAATTYLLNLLTSVTGVDTQARLLAADENDFHVTPVRVFLIQNASADLTERTLSGKYPAVLVYCDKLANTLKEKFRVFAGTARLNVEVRCSQDRLEGLDQKLQLYATAVGRVLEGARGDWKLGLYYAGQYEVLYGPVKTGGKYFLQSAKITLELEVSR